MTDNAQNNGLVAPFSALVRSRPDRRTTGFAPGGKVRTHQFGTNRSVYRGRGMEFDEARIYQPGDDARAIDWRVTARTGKMHTKLFHEERERPVLILADLRASMHFGTRVQFKSVLAATIAAELAWVGIDGGDRVGGFILLPSGVTSFPATRNTSAMLRLLKVLSEGTKADDEPGGETMELPLHSAVDRLRQVSRPGTLVFIVSDFADFDERTARAIKRLSLHAHVTNVLVYDQLDTMLPHEINGFPTAITSPCSPRSAAPRSRSTPRCSASGGSGSNGSAASAACRSLPSRPPRPRETCLLRIAKARRREPDRKGTPHDRPFPRPRPRARQAARAASRHPPARRHFLVAARPRLVGARRRDGRRGGRCRRHQLCAPAHRALPRAQRAE